MEIPAVSSTWVRPLALAFFFSAFPGHGRPPTPNHHLTENGHTKETTMQFPSRMQIPESPHLDKPGLKVALSATAYKPGEPVAMFGAYIADGTLYAKCFGDVDPWIMVTAFGRDIPGVWTKPVLVKPNLAPAPTKPWPLPDPSFVQGGFFNLDLREHLQLPAQPARYWLQVSMGDYFTDRIPFELK